MIELKNISKTYRILKRGSSIKETFKSFFSKNYTEIQALKDVSFKINEGEIVGYIGPNGAGKSSSVKIMSGILTPDSGECRVCGMVPWKERKDYVRNIGVVFGQRSQLWWDVPVIDSFELLKDIYGVSDNVYKKNLSELTELLNLQEILKTPVRQLSLGQRMRCEVSAALLHDPKVLFLDEPTIGLDAVSKIAVRDFIKKINEEKKTTVILTTHDMQDIEAITNRILFIGKGQILLDGTLSDLKKHGAQNKNLTVEYRNGKINLENAKGISLLSDFGGRAVFSVDSSTISIPEAVNIISKDLDIVDLSVSSESIENTVAALYKEYGV